MTEMKIANWNVEWMNRWFTSDSDGPASFRNPHEITGVTDVEALATRVARVIRGMGPDVLTVQEGPSRRTEMELFVRDFLDDAYAILGPAGGGQQKPYALVRKDSRAVTESWRIYEEYSVDFDDVWEVDIDSDLVPDEYRFTRPPLVVGLETSSGRVLRLVNLHTKSKYVHNGAAMWRDPARRQAFIELAVKARRRISAEALRVRHYLNSLFQADPDAAVVVAGDFNDGPGLDFFERTYMTHNVAGLIAGSPYAPQRMLRHAFIDLEQKERNWTVEFYDFVDKESRRILLDHIFVSPALYWKGEDRNVTGRIEHELYEEMSDPSLPGERERRPSDHRPQTATFEV